jgi:hypothetical protein
MFVRLTDQRPLLPRHLQRLMDTPIADDRIERMPERMFSKRLPYQLPKELEDRLFRYHIFPPRILQSLPQWEHENRHMRTGDTIAQQIQIPPLLHASVKIIMGVRITEVFREADRMGFSYATLEGHVEVGVSTFLFERADSEWCFTVRVRSAPGNLLTRLVGPIFTMPYRNWSIRQALRHVVTEGAPPTPWDTTHALSK